MITKIEEKESPNKGMCWLRVTVIGEKNEEEKRVFEEGKRIRWVSQKLQASDFRVNNGLPVKANPPYYFFIVECPLKRKDRTKQAIKEIAEAGGAKNAPSFLFDKDFFIRYI